MVDSAKVARAKVHTLEVEAVVSTAEAVEPTGLLVEAAQVTLAE